ncbi:MAG TPA: hypothetical protein VF937_04875, partial [Chloroflexota bacterium]
ASAAAELRQCFEELGRLGERYFRPLVGALLAQATCADQRYEEALTLVAEVEAMAAEDDVEAQALWRSVRAKVLARGSLAAAAPRLAREAVELVASADAPVLQGDAYVDLGVVLAQMGEADQALDALGRARELYVRKAAVGTLRRVDALVTGLEALLPAAGARLAPREPVPLISG